MWEGLFNFELHCIGIWETIYRGTSITSVSFSLDLRQVRFCGKEFFSFFFCRVNMAANTLGIALGKKARGICIQPLLDWGFMAPRLYFRLQGGPGSHCFSNSFPHILFPIFLVLPISDPFGAVVQIILILNIPCCQLGIWVSWGMLKQLSHIHLLSNFQNVVAVISSTVFPTLIEWDIK